MQHSFINIDSVIASVKSLLKSYNQQGAILEEDCEAWAASAIRLIGATHYEDKIVELDICNHTAILPKDFYLLKEIWVLCNENWKSSSVANTVKRNFMSRGDSSTVQYLTKDCNNYFSDCVEQSFIIKAPPGVIRTSFRTGKIALTYMFIPTDEDGRLMIQDEENTLEAVKFYIITQILTNALIMREIPENVFMLFESKWLDALKQAKAVLKFPDDTDMQTSIMNNNTRYNKFNINFRK